jgi:6-pyruvoyltetrahydropterin/6-carboxytetrahydropterin synthase
MPTFLTRRVSFAAAHRYRVAAWSDAQNVAAFGPCARPNFHGHGYVCDVTVTGAVDETTGFVVDLPRLDAALRAEVHDRFDHSNINLDVPEFAEGKLIPSGENLARFICERVQVALGDAARVVRVVIAEDAMLSAIYEPD